MSSPFASLARLDKRIHEPARLAIVSALAAYGRTEFLDLQSLTGLTRGNLSAQLSKLEQAGLVEIEKRFVGKRPNTRARLTTLGLDRVDRYWEELDELGSEARLRPSEP